MAYVHEHVHGNHVDEIHHYDTDRKSNTGNLIGLIVLIILLAVLFTYGIPILRNLASFTAPRSTQINVPDKINVNVNTPNSK